MPNRLEPRLIKSKTLVDEDQFKGYDEVNLEGLNIDSALIDDYIEELSKEDNLKFIEISDNYKGELNFDLLQPGSLQLWFSKSKKVNFSKATKLGQQFSSYLGPDNKF
jgi:hypothetical protein